MGLVLLIVVRTFRLLNVPTKHGKNSADSLEVVEQGCWIRWRHSLEVNTRFFYRYIVEDFLLKFFGRFHGCKAGVDISVDDNDDDDNDDDAQERQKNVSKRDSNNRFLMWAADVDS